MQNYVSLRFSDLFCQFCLSDVDWTQILAFGFPKFLSHTFLPDLNAFLFVFTGMKKPLGNLYFFRNPKNVHCSSAYLFLLFFEIVELRIPGRYVPYRWPNMTDFVYKLFVSPLDF